MAETTEKKDPSVLSKRVLNRSIVGRVYFTKDGRQLVPGAVLDVTPDEHARLCRYHDLVDADKLGPKGKTLSDALKENEELRKKLSKLEDEGEDAEKLKAHIAELQEKLAKRK